MWGSERVLSKLRQLQQCGTLMKSANLGLKNEIHASLFNPSILTQVIFSIRHSDVGSDTGRRGLMMSHLAKRMADYISESAALKDSGGTRFSARVRLNTEGGEKHIALNHELLWLSVKHTDCAGDNAKCRNFNFIWIVWWETGQENSRKACRRRGCLSRSLFVSLQWQHSATPDNHPIGICVKIVSGWQFKA